MKVSRPTLQCQDFLKYNKPGRSGQHRSMHLSQLFIYQSITIANINLKAVALAQSMNLYYQISFMIYRG